MSGRNQFNNTNSILTSNCKANADAQKQPNYTFVFAMVWQVWKWSFIRSGPSSGWGPTNPHFTFSYIPFHLYSYLHSIINNSDLFSTFCCLNNYRLPWVMLEMHNIKMIKTGYWTMWKRGIDFLGSPLENFFPRPLRS